MTWICYVARGTNPKGCFYGTERVYVANPSVAHIVVLMVD